MQTAGRLTVCLPKTGPSERVIALDHTTVAVLRAHCIAQQAERAQAGEGYRGSGYVFTCLGGDPTAPDRLSRAFRRLSAEAGLPPVRLRVMTARPYPGQPPAIPASPVTRRE